MNMYSRLIVRALLVLGFLCDAEAQRLRGIKSQIFGGTISPFDVIAQTSSLPQPFMPSPAFTNLLGRRLLVPQQYAAIQTAIDSAVHGDTVLVSAGMYYENIDFKGKAIVVASYMILNGDTTARNNTIINGNQSVDPNKGSVVSFVSGEDTTSVVYGFTILGGTGTLHSSTFRVGGGIYCRNSGARIVHNKITNNSITHSQVCLGGGIGSSPDQSAAQLIIEDNLVVANSALAQNNCSGGGIFLYYGGRISRNIIGSNLASAGPSGIAAFGGGISLSCPLTANRAYVEVIGNTIASNEARSPDASVGGIGGGIDIQKSRVLLLDNSFTRNSVIGAQPEGGGGARICLTGGSVIRNNHFLRNASVNLTNDLWGSGGGLRAWDTDSLVIQSNRFEGNESAGGGGISAEQTRGNLISNNRFVNNRSYIGGGIYETNTDGSAITGNKLTSNAVSYLGGGICVEECSPVIHNNLIVNNSAGYNGGGIYVGDQNSQPHIINNTIVWDSAGVYGGGICANSVSPIIMNTIVWGNVSPGGTQIYTTGGSTKVVYSDVQGGWPDTGNIDADPTFRDTTMHLASSSPCIGRGIDSMQIGGAWLHAPPFCYDGYPRPSPAGTRPDIGACEEIITGVEEQPNGLPRDFSVEQNYPNPFNPSTTINYQLPTASRVSLKVFDILGRDIVTLVDEVQDAGFKSVQFDGGGIASGVYLYRLQAGSYSYTRKMIVLR